MPPLVSGLPTILELMAISPFVTSNIFPTEIPCVPGSQMRGAEGTPSWLEARGGRGHPPYT
jgi:hypothetical protein